ncbi:MAG TPA: AI-2E family transporter [Dokdonella sp.]
MSAAREPSADVAPTPVASALAQDAGAPPAAQSVRPNRQRNRLLGAIVVAIVAYTCVIAQAVIVPVLVAILLGLILAPAVRLLERWRIPRAIGASLAVIFTVVVTGAAFAALATPARAWMTRMPQALSHLETAMRDLRKPLQAATSAAHDLGKLANLDGGQPAPFVNTSPGFLSQALVAAPALLAGIIVVVFLLFLFLLHGDDLLRKFVTLAPHLRAKRDLVGATRQAQHELSLYMITITLINTGLGLATAAALFALKIPDPLLWGGVAALLNFAPFVGPLLTAIALAIVGFGEFASPLSALAAPAAFLGLHMIESQLVTPHLVGRRLALDPVMVFLALIALGWMWGVAGLLLAVPLLSCAKIIAERAPDGNVVATLLSR